MFFSLQFNINDGRSSGCVSTDFLLHVDCSRRFIYSRLLRYLLALYSIRIICIYIEMNSINRAFLFRILVLPAIYVVVTRKNVFTFAKNMFEAFLIAIATSSR